MDAHSLAGFQLARFIRHQGEEFKRIAVSMLTPINAKCPLWFGPHDIEADNTDPKKQLRSREKSLVDSYIINTVWQPQSAYGGLGMAAQQ